MNSSEGGEKGRGGRETSRTEKEGKERVRVY